MPDSKLARRREERLRRQAERDRDEREKEKERERAAAHAVGFRVVIFYFFAPLNVITGFDYSFL